LKSEAWVKTEKIRMNKGIEKIDAIMKKTLAEMDATVKEDRGEEYQKLGRKLFKLEDERMQCRGKLKAYNKVLEVKF